MTITIGWMCNEQNIGLRNTVVRLVRSRQEARLIASTTNLFDSVDYSDGSFINVYYVNGEWVGIEYDANCNMKVR